MTPTVRNLLVCLASAALLTACGDDANDDDGGTNNDTNNVANNVNNTNNAANNDNNTTNNVANNTTNNVTNNTTNNANNTAAAVEEVDCATVTAAATVSMDGNAFLPAATTIAAGDVVEWSNDEGAVPHTVTSGRSGDADSGDLFDSGSMQPGDTYCLQFNDPGTVEYWCIFHPGTMNDGVITVE